LAANSPQDTLRRQLAAGVLRLRFNDGLNAACWAAAGAFVLMALLIAAQRVVFLGAPVSLPVLALIGMPAWALWVMLGLALVPVPVGLVAGALSRKGILTAAVLADERLGLRARLSSVVTLDARSARSPMAPALLDDARRYSAAVRARRDFPIRAPRSARFLPAGLLALTVAMLVPRADVFGRERKVLDEQREKEDVKLAAEELEKRLQEALKRKPEERAGGKELPSQKLEDDLSKLVEEMKEIQDREEAVTRLNKLLDKAKLESMRLSSMAEMMRRMERMKKLGEKADLPKGMAAKLGAAMAANDFKAAAAEMKKLMDKLKNQNLSDAEKAELQRELEKLAKLSDDWKELSDALQKAAGNLGNDEGFEAMDEALEGLEELAQLLKDLGLDGAEGPAGEAQRVKLTQEMIDQLKKMLKNAKKCAQCKKLYCLNCGLPRCACEGLQQCECPPGGS
jgi:hypothetical protein